MEMPALILVETSLAGNLGAVIRVAANFGVERLELVRPQVDPSSPEVVRRACGGDQRLRITAHESFAAATGDFRTLLATASGRGRPAQPVLSPTEALALLAERGAGDAALVFGTESSGLPRAELDRCDATIRIPTVVELPVLNLAQAVAILLGTIAIGLAPSPGRRPPPAEQATVEALMEHLARSLDVIGFLDPANPDRILRKLRRLFGRAGITEDEVAILRGVCRQMEWAARTAPRRFDDR